MIGDVVRVTGLTFVDSTGQSAQAGTSEIVFNAGDGSAPYFVDVTVTAFSTSENWLMGVTRIRHTYQNPFLSRGTNIYPAGYSFEAATGASLGANQPYANIPYTAFFKGCCRLGVNSLDLNANDPYRLETFVDLTDRDNSPASRSLPLVTVSSGTDDFFVLARDQYMKSSDNPISMSGGNTNYPVDDYNNNATALMYYIAQSRDLGFTSEAYNPWSAVTIDPVTGRVSLINFNLPSPGIYQLSIAVKSSASALCADRSSSTCECMTTGSGCSKTIIDMMVRVVTGQVPTVCNTTELRYSKLNGWVGYSMSVPICVQSSLSSSLLLLNYVFAGLSVEASSLGANATGDFGVVTYSAGELSSQGLPAGAQLLSSAPGAIVDLALSFDNPFDAHRPAHDWAVNKLQRDYVNAPRAQALWDAGYRPLYRAGKSVSDLDLTRLTATLSYAAFDLNAGTGGAAVYLWVRRSDWEPAVTSVNLSACADQEQALAAQGFTRLPQNLNEQAESAVPAVYLWFKRGSGSPIVDLVARDLSVEGQCPGCTGPSVPLGSCFSSSACPACTPKQNGALYQLVSGDANEGTASRPLVLYLLRASQAQLNRRLDWTPQVPGHYIMCYAGTDTNSRCFDGQSSVACSSVQRCVDMNVTNDPAPAFLCGAQCSLATSMGRTLSFNLSYFDIPHPDESLTIAADPSSLQLAGAVLVGSPVRTLVGAMSLTTQLVTWFPNPAYGGFSGLVCYKGWDQAGAYRLVQSTQGCVLVTVDRCRWVVQSEDSLIQIAARFSTNWLQVWHLNPTLLHPDDALVPDTLVNVGHLYQVEPNDALSALATRFGTTVASIQANNWDLGNVTDTGLTLGKSICVIPSSCKTAANIQTLYLPPPLPTPRRWCVAGARPERPRAAARDGRGAGRRQAAAAHSPPHSPHPQHPAGKRTRACLEAARLPLPLAWPGAARSRGSPLSPELRLRVRRRDPAGAAHRAAPRAARAAALPVRAGAGNHEASRNLLHRVGWQASVAHAKKRGVAWTRCRSDERAKF
eukprot:CAMPEP_0113684128 /NCGR_PEP_ID=MMETSP0038_2-20120614/13784_1 /TAXON_ID=2898 /ORGANISM="Cryptomonas paramecium" /LENGTH=1026 /DNA_ID=CAMNT_0000603749 /DNA_START=237 /DNA_END=3319 /DNA_ORIENTATION=+ /assembly_acc=CAM_ASM_000170